MTTTTTRITAATVRYLGDWAAEVSNGALVVGDYFKSESGACYADGNDWARVFTGKTATREAALFYGFAAHEVATRRGVEPPAWVDEILLTLLESPAAVVRAGDAGLDHVDAIMPTVLRRSLALVAA